jgi:Na+/phosphate symporter
MDASVVVKLLGGIGLFLLGIHHLTEGLKGLSGDSLRRALQRFVSTPPEGGVTSPAPTKPMTVRIVAVED